MIGKRIMAMGLIGMLTLGMGALSVSADEAAEDGIAGVYKMDESYFDDSEASAEEIEMMKSVGSMMRLVINEDGTGAMEILGEKTELEWNEDEIIMDGEGAPYTFEDGVLTLGEGEEVMAFRKMTAEELENDESGPLTPGDYDPDTHAGYYKLSTMEQDGEVTDASVLAMLGMDVYLVLNEDNTGRISLFGVPMELTWDDDVITMEGEDAEYSYDAGTITMESEGSVLSFVYVGTPDEAPEPEEEAAEPTEEAAE